MFYIKKITLRCQDVITTLRCHDSMMSFFKLNLIIVFIQKDRSVSRYGQGIIFLFQADILKANLVLYGILCGVSIFRRDRGLDVWRKEVYRLPAY
jgi:hypothetical protein